MANINKSKILAFFTAGSVLAGTAGVLIDLEGAKDISYIDGGGVSTVCVGHTEKGPSGIPVISNKKYTPSECADLLKHDLAPTYQAVTGLIKTPVSNLELSAYTSFAFNVGIEAFKTSTLLKLLNQGDRVGAANQLKRWIMDNGKVSQGLINRRAAEYSMAIEGIRSNPKGINEQ